MTRTNRLTILALVCMMLASCGDLFLGSDPESTPEKNFEIFWNDFDKTYSFFELKNMNWDSLYAMYRPQVTGQTTGEQLFEIISSMLAHLNDGHVKLNTPHGSYSYTGWYDQFPENFLGITAVEAIATLRPWRTVSPIRNGFLDMCNIEMDPNTLILPIYSQTTLNRKGKNSLPSQ